jgi:hypothetical protein
MKIYKLCLLFLLSASFLGSETKTNLTDEELIYQCLRRTGEKISDKLLGNGYSEICILDDGSGDKQEENFIIIESITGEIKSGGGLVYLKKENDEFHKPALYFKIIKGSVNISEKSRFFGDPIVKRDANTIVSFRLVEPETGEILMAKEVEEFLTNSMSKNEYEAIGGKKKNEGVSFSSLLEPAAITAIIAGLMYLFYSQKSN